MNLEEDRMEEIIRQAVAMAQEKARKEGLKIGTLVAHPDDEFMYYLQAVEGNMAQLYIPGDDAEDGKPVLKVFPLDEIFDVQDVGNLALTLRYLQIVSAAENN